MAINRLRLQHQAEEGSKTANRILSLLERPDRLIGLILIGNNFVNILASAIATVLAVRIFGDAGVAIATGVLTLVILIFAEVTPKTFAALHPERIARPASFILLPLLRVTYPLVWTTNLLSNGLLRLLGINPENSQRDRLTKEELRTLMMQSGHRIPARRHGMLLSILDLEKVQVDEIMVPRGEIIEDAIRYIYEQSMTMNKPEKIGFQLDNLLTNVDETAKLLDVMDLETYEGQPQEYYSEAQLDELLTQIQEKKARINEAEFNKKTSQNMDFSDHTTLKKESGTSGTSKSTSLANSNSSAKKEMRQ